MLYDPKWEQKTETKANPFKLETLIAWLEKQPADEGYEYDCNGHCLLAQYFTAMGFTHVYVGSTGFYHGDDSERAEMPRAFDKIAVKSPSTFGAALERARAALS
jgi:hypothetical protein